MRRLNRTSENRFGGLVGLSVFIAVLGLTACAQSPAAEEMQQAEETSPGVEPAFASAQYDQTPPVITEWMAEPALLVFSKTMEWRHNEGIAGANRFFADLTAERGYGLYTTENGAIFNDKDLARFDVVIFNNMTGDALSPAQRYAFKSWLLQGGAWIGLHGAGDNSHTAWEWYDKTLIGPEFISHPMAPQFQEADLVTLNTDHPVTAGLPARFSLSDEWYSFDGVPQDYGLTPLIGLDEGTYSPLNNAYGEISDLRMGPEPEDHPIIWVGEIEGARIVYSGVGHNQTNYDDPTYAQFLTQAFDWVRTRDSGE